jgi:hypothetical protein
MKFNSGIALLGLFVAAVLGGGAVLLNQPDDTAKALPPQSASAEFAKPGATLRRNPLRPRPQPPRLPLPRPTNVL